MKINLNQWLAAAPVSVGFALTVLGFVGLLVHGSPLIIFALAWFGGFIIRSDDVYEDAKVESTDAK